MTEISDSDPRRFSYKEIRNRVNHEVMKFGLSPISLSTIKLFLSQPEIQNRYKPFRLGKKWTEDNLHPYLIRKVPNKVNYLWESDCSVLNFYVVDEFGEIGRRYLCVIYDRRSRDLISWRIGKYETGELVSSTLSGALIKYNVIPLQFLHDNSSAYRSKLMQALEAKLEAAGSNIRLTKPGNAKDKAVERLFKSLQYFFRSKRGYLGDGVRSFVEEGRVEPNLRKMYYDGKADGLYTESELHEMVDEVITLYRNTTLSVVDRSPSQLYNEPQSFGGIQVANSEIIKIVAEISRIIKVRRSIIEFDLDKNTYSYTLTDPKMTMAFNGTAVRVRAVENDLTSIYLYDVNEDKFIGVVKQTIPTFGDKGSMESADYKALRDHQNRIDAIDEETVNSMNESLEGYVDEEFEIVTPI